MTQIFVSHSMPGTPAAHKLREIMTTFGHEVVTAESTKSSKHLVDDLMEQIRSADVVIGVLDEQSTNVIFELGFALGLGKRIVLLSSDIASPPLMLSNLPHLRVDEIDERTAFGILAVVASMAEHSESADPNDRFEGFRKGPERSDPSFERGVVETFGQMGAHVGAASVLAVPGYDFVVNHAKLSKRYLISVKRYARSALVSIETVRELAAAIEETGADAGLIIASSDFTPSARDFAKRSRVSLIVWRPEEIERKDVLEGRTNRREWPFVWRQLLQQDFEGDTLRQLGFEWLQAHRDQREWPFVWGELLRQDFEGDRLRQLGFEWLQAHRDQREWPFVWRQLLQQDFEGDRLRQFGFEWLQAHRDQREWPFVWGELLRQDFEGDRLREIGRDWLQRHIDHPQSDSVRLRV